MTKLERLRVATFSCGLVIVLAAALLAASDHDVQFDHDTNFPAIRTFALRDQKVETLRPEFDNPLFLKMVAAAVRHGLVAKGLTETAASPDVFADDRIDVVDVSTVGRTGAVRIPPGPGSSGLIIPSSGPEPVRYVHGTLVIDLTLRGDGVLAWRGTFHDDERTGAKLVDAILDGARTLTSAYPPKQP